MGLYVDKNNKEELKESFLKIQERLGGQHVKTALEALDANDYEEAARVALKYYDKTYDFNLENNISPDIRIASSGEGLN